MKKHAIVGFGCAGYSAAKAIRQLSAEDEIHVFEVTGDPPANPMLTTYYASGKLGYDGAFPFGTLPEIEQSLGLTMHSKTKVRRVHAEGRKLELEDGSEQTFDNILISTGARALLSNLKGLPDERVFLMRTMEDACRLRQYLDTHPVKKAVVVGASMVGIKVAELLLNRGADTTIADFASWLFPLASFENVGRELERRVAAKGIHFKWKAAIEEISKAGARFSDGEELEADLICLCIGTRANVELAANTEVAQDQPIAIRHGIVVNNRMETTAPGIYAAGDCCEGINLQSGETMIIGLWANAGCQGETAGYNMAGKTAEYAGNIVYNITHFMNMDFIGLGDNRLKGETVTFGDLHKGTYVQAVLRDGALQCVNILDAYAVSGILKSCLLKQLAGEKAALTPVQKGLLLKAGLEPAFVELIGGKE